MGYHDAIGGGNHVHEWNSLGQSNAEIWLCPVSSSVGINCSVV